MAKHIAKKPTRPTHREPGTPRQPDWKKDRYEQRKLKVVSRRTITGGF
jgi:hypothetical protein